MLGVLTGLLSVAPSIVSLFRGKDEKGKNDIANDVINIAKTVVGVDDEEQALQALKTDPELATRFREQVLEYHVQMRELDVQQLETVNKTMRMEYQVGGNVKNFWQFLLAFWKSGWRPYWGWISGTSFGAIFLGMLALIWRAIDIKEGTVDVTGAVQLTNGLATLIGSATTLFGIALVVLGVSIRERSKDKRSAQGGGSEDSGGLGGLMSAIIERVKPDKK